MATEIHFSHSVEVPRQTDQTGGKAIAIVRSNEEKGEIILTVSAQGLNEATVTIHAD